MYFLLNNSHRSWYYMCMWGGFFHRHFSSVCEREREMVNCACACAFVLIILVMKTMTDLSDEKKKKRPTFFFMSSSRNFTRFFASSTPSIIHRRSQNFAMKFSIRSPKFEVDVEPRSMAMIEIKEWTILNVKIQTKILVKIC